MRSFLSLFLFLVMLTLQGCGKVKELKVNLLLDWWPNPNHVPIYAGICEGIFEKHGIDLEILKVTDAPDSINFLNTKRADLALFYMPNTLRAAHKMEELRVLAPYIKKAMNVFLFREDTGIRDSLDFHGKTLGGVPDGLVEAFVETLMSNTSIMFSGVKKLQFDQVSAMLNRSVDIITGVYDTIEGEQLRAMGVRVKSIPICEFNIPNYHELVFLSRNDFIQKDPEIVKRFQNAIDEAIQFSVLYPDQAFYHYRKLNPNKDDKTILWETKAWLKTVPYLAQDQDFDVVCWEVFHDWMLEKKLLQGPVNLLKLLEYKAD